MSEHHLTPQSPLMHPVEYQGQMYFTSQYFHTEYLRNSPNGGKYRRHGDFLRLLKSIEAYQDHVKRGDIAEIAWKSSKDVGKQNLLSYKLLFQAAGWNPLTLLNATAQAAMSHHLDDELSKQMSVAINTQAARQSARSQQLLPHESATRILATTLEAGVLLGTPLHIAQQEAVKMVEASTGINFRPFLQGAAAQQQIAPDEEMLEPTEIAKRLEFPSAYAFNLALEKIGWQVKRIGGGWEPTPTGFPFASRHAWTAERGSKSGYNWKWKIEAVRNAIPLPVKEEQS